MPLSRIRGLKTRDQQPSVVMDALADQPHRLTHGPRLGSGTGSAEAVYRVQKVYVVLTDGHPDDPEGTIEECHRIRRTGGRIITVGVGRQVQQDYLRAVLIAQ